MSHVDSPRAGYRLPSFVIEYWPKCARHFDKIVLRSQHGADVFVCRRRFVTQNRRQAAVKPDALHLPPQLQFADLASRRGATEGAACAVGARTKRFFAATALNVKADRSH